MALCIAPPPEIRIPPRPRDDLLALITGPAPAGDRAGVHLTCFGCAVLPAGLATIQAGTSPFRPISTAVLYSRSPSHSKVPKATCMLCRRAASLPQQPKRQLAVLLHPAARQGAIRLALKRRQMRHPPGVRNWRRYILSCSLTVFFPLRRPKLPDRRDACRPRVAITSLSGACRSIPSSY